MIKPQHRRVGFYPASARDYLEPLQMLKGWVDKMVFCDIKCSPRNSRELAELRKTAMDNDLPEPSFFLGEIQMVKVVASSTCWVRINSQWCST